MENEKIQLQRERDFGQVFNAAFAFLRQEFKPFSRAFLVFVLPVILLISISMIAFYKSMFSNMGNITYDYGISYMVRIYENVGVILLLFLLAQCFLNLTVISYVKLYKTTGTSPDLNQLFESIRKNFFPTLGAVLLSGIVIAIGAMFCLLPGIYLAVSLSLFIIALIIENEGIGSAFSRSFQLTHIQWWWTFLIILVSGIVIYVLFIIMQIPAYVIGIGSLLHNLHGERTATVTFSNTYIIYQSVVSAIAQFIYTIPVLILTFHYFSLVEIRERPSLIEKLEELGDHEESPN